MNRLLVVHPDPHARARIRELAAGSGYEVHEAASGIGAIPIARTEPPAAVVLGLSPHEPRDFVALQLLRSTVPVGARVLALGVGDPELRAVAEVLGACGVLEALGDGTQLLAWLAERPSSPPLGGTFASLP